MVCFSVGNLANVARLYPRRSWLRQRRQWRREGRGTQDRLAVGDAETVGNDFNDLHQSDGLSTAQGLLRALGE